MTDYIKREDAKDAVINVVGWDSIARYVDEMSKHFCTKDNDYYDALIDAEDAIDDLPSADVAPVVRCKDCTYYCPLDDSRPYDCLRSGMLCVRKDDFCSCGKERR